MRSGNPSSDTKLTVGFEALMVLVGISLIADWVTPKDPSRRFSKLIDSLLGIGWLVVMAATTLYGLSMGTL
jgi:hypothetical protein